MTSTDIAVRTQQVVEQLQNPVFLEQVKESLPETVSLERFKRVAITAIRANPDLVEADQTSLFASIVRCAQDGLFPDGKQAALVIYKGKVSYLPMIGGVRKIAAEYGWAIRTEVVYENDEFEYTSEPPVIHHRPLRPGVERGELLYAYAVAVHADGRRIQKVMHREEINKRRKMAQTDMVWKAWTAQMWEKTVGHEIADELPLSDHERYVRALAASRAETEPAEAAELLYGPDGSAFTMTELPAAAESPTDTAPSVTAGPGGGDQQAETATPSPAAVSVPGADDDPEPVPAAQQELANAARVVADTKIPNGAYIGKTLDELAGEGADGEQWLGWALRNPGKFDDTFYAAVETFVQGALPALWAEHSSRAAA